MPRTASVAPVEPSSPKPPKVGRVITGPEIEFSRRRAGLSIDDLALLTDVPAFRIARIENGAGFTVLENATLKEALLAFGATFRLDFDPRRHGRGTRGAATASRDLAPCDRHLCS